VADEANEANWADELDKLNKADTPIAANETDKAKANEAIEAI
jgi:hypothetical protein